MEGAERGRCRQKAGAGFQGVCACVCAHVCWKAGERGFDFQIESKPSEEMWLLGEVFLGGLWLLKEEIKPNHGSGGCLHCGRMSKGGMRSSLQIGGSAVGSGFLSVKQLGWSHLEVREAQEPSSGSPASTLLIKTTCLILSINQVSHGH